MKTLCNHELYIEEQSFISSKYIRVKLKCSLCNKNFEGVVHAKGLHV